MRYMIAVLALAAFITQQSAASIDLTSIAPSYSQNFDTLVNLGTSSMVPASWAFNETGPGANGDYDADNGQSELSGTYSYGSTGSTERAFGTLLRGISPPFFSASIGAEFRNVGMSPIESLTITYRGEQWRLGNDGTDRLDFAFSLDAIDLTTGSWTAFDALDFHSPSATGGPAKDGNATGNFATVSATISSLSVAPSQKIWIRWSEFQAPGPDDGLAIDDFMITAAFSAVPEPGAFLFGGAVCGVIGVMLGARLLNDLRHRPRREKAA